MAIRRRTLVDRALEVAILMGDGWLALAVFPPVQLYMHNKFGDALFNAVGANGNSAGDFLLGVMLMPVLWGLFLGLRRLAHRVPAFLVDV